MIPNSTDNVFRIIFTITRLSHNQTFYEMEWFKGHLAQLREKYESKLVAVLDGAIIAIGDDLEEVARIIERKKRTGEIKGTPYTIQVEWVMTSQLCIFHRCMFEN